jgi:hypothetical protein
MNIYYIYCNIKFFRNVYIINISKNVYSINIFICLYVNISVLCDVDI